MRVRVLASLVLVGLALGGCGKQAADQTDRAAPSSKATAAPPSSTNTAANAQKAANPAAALARPTEESNVPPPETTGDAITHKAILAAVAAAVAAATPAATAQSLTGPTPWQEGVNYTKIVPAQPTSVPAGQVEVLEFFWYACPHCYSIDPLVEAWRKTKPAYVTFSRVHVTWTEGHRSLARLYYTLDSLGKLDTLHTEVFKEIHDNGDPLLAPNPADAAQNERVQAAFVKKFGISDDTFTKAYESFGVETALQRAEVLMQRYRIDGVPTFVVNGKYVADVRTAGTPEKLIALVGDLAALEHKHQ